MTTSQFVDASRLKELSDLPEVNWDLARLIRLCEELNQAFAAGSFHAVAALTRAVLDHVPPVFGCNSFKEVANNYAGGKSFRDTMRYLDESARKIADAHLHSQIRDREVLPNATQVDVRPAMDLLISEVIRINKIAAGRLDELESKVLRATELMPDFLCPACRAPIARREPGFGSISYEWGDLEVEWEDVYYECGYETHDGDETKPCGRKA